MRTGTRLLASLLLLTSWYACDRPTPVAPADSTLTITANPTRIAVLGQAIITVLARKTDGRAVNEGTEINFSTNLGTIDTVVLTDARGIAEATLEGDGRIGLATVSAESGAAGSATLDVQIGALASFISLTASPQIINKDLPRKGENIKLTAEVSDDLNNLIRGVSVRFESLQVGEFEEGGSVVTNLNGRAKNTLVVTEVRNITDGLFEITASTAGDGGTEVSATAEIAVSGFAANIRLTVTPTSLPVTGGVVRLSALVIDDLGEAAAGEGVIFSTDLGLLTSGGGLVEADADGQARDTLRVTATDLSTPGVTAITVGAEVSGSGGVFVASDPKEIPIQTDVPIAGFDFAVSGLTVNFTNTTTGAAPLTYMWNFGDGGTSTSENPGNTYAVDGTYQVSLEATNIGGTSTITKDVVVAPQPDIALSPTTLSFGSAANPGTVDRVLTISNAGLAPLTVSGFSFSNVSYAAVSPVPPSLGPGATANITVRFSPPVVVASTAQNGTLTVLSDDPTNPAAAVTLTGTALP